MTTPAPCTMLSYNTLGSFMSSPWIYVKRSLSILLAGIFAFSIASAAAQTPTAFSGSTKVGQQSAPLSVTVTMTGNGISAAPQALLQGVSGQDFTLASGGTCAAGVVYVAGQQCTVNVIFAPLYPGQRFGAVTIATTLGAPLGSTLLYGMATGSLSVLQDGEINTVAGDGDWIFHSDGVLAVDAPIFLPTAVVTDPSGNIYISDSNNNRVRRVNAQTGQIITIAGIGIPGYLGDSGLAVAAMVNTPGAMALDGAGNLYFADTGNHAIRKIDAVTGIISTVAGTGGVQGYFGDGGLATSAKLSLPQGIAFDAAQNLYISDTGNNVIREVNAVTGIITTIAGVQSQFGYNGDSILATTAYLYSPWNLAVGPDGSLYFADLGNNRIRKISTGGIITTVAGTGVRNATGDGGSPTAATLDAPATVVLDPAGDIYIGDSGNNRVREINVSTNVITTIVGTGSEDFSGDGGSASNAGIYGPYALYFDQTGNLFVSDMFHNRVREIEGTTITLGYNTIRVGKVSPPQVEVLVNDGNANLTLAAPSFTNAALDPATTTCNTGSIVPSANTCNLGVEFAPTTLGTLVQGDVAVNSDAGNSPTVIDVSGQVLSVNPTSTSLTSSLNPSLLNTSVTFTASVSAGGATTTGLVTFYDGNIQLCSVSLNANDTAACAISTLALGQHSITASYAGDSDDAASVSPVLIQIVKQAATVVLTASPNPAIVTSSVALVATVTAPSGTPTGTIVFYDGTTAIGSAAVNGSGVATFSTALLSAATHSLTAQYSGDTTNASATSNVVSEVIQLATSVTTLASNQATATVGTTVTFTSSVTSTNGPAPTGTVQFTDGTTLLGSASVLANGTASLPVSILAPGAHAIVATYSGDSDNATSSSSPFVETINQIATATTLTSDLNPANAGATVHLTANVAMVAGSVADGAISGKVTFSNGSTSLGSVIVDANGNAVLAVSTLAVGQNIIVATYAGNTNYAGSTSTSLSEQINQTSTTTVLTSSNLNALEGKATTFTATVTTATGIPTGNVNFLDNGVNVGVGTLSAQGVATLSLSTLPVGTQTMDAVYIGDSNYTTSTSAPLAEIVSLATPTVTLVGPGSPVNAGISLTFTGTISSNGVTPTAGLTLRDGTTAIATQNAVASGSFSFSTSALGIGSHSLTVTYAGDADNAAAVSNTLVVVVQQAPTTTSLSSSINPQIVGQSVTLTATVTSVSANLGGSVNFLDGTTPLGAATLGANGTASFSTSQLSFGTHSLTAVYSGDTNHATSTSSIVNEQIVQAATATLSSSVNPSIAGANVIFTAKLAGVGTTIPTGSIIFADNGTTLGSVAVDPTGAASFASTTLAVGSHTITATYAGDKNYSGASASLIQTIQNANTQVVLTSSVNPSVYGIPMELTAAITSNGGIATGSVTFTDGGVLIGSGVLSSTGVATLTLSTLAPGSHTIVANYPGDGRASPSSSTPLTQVVKELSTVVLASNVNPAQTLAPVTLTAVVSNSGIGTPTGTVTFTDGGAQLGIVTLDATGTATLTVPALSAGNHTLLASYTGDGDNFSGTSSALVVGVTLRPTTTALTATQTSANNPLQVTLISVERWTGSVVPTGTVTFMEGTTAIGSSPVDGTGVATLTIVLQSATETLYAIYSGDTAYATSTSPSVTVGGGQATQFTLSLDPPSMTLQSKQHSVATLTMNSIQNFADTLQLGCVGLPTAASCTFSSTTAKLVAGGTTTVQITVDTGNPLGSGAESASNIRKQTSSVMLCFLPVGLLAGLALFRSRRRSLPALLLLLCAIAVTFGATGCAGLQINGTPAGTYTFKVTAVGQQTGVSAAQVMTLTVTQ